MPRQDSVNVKGRAPGVVRVQTDSTDTDAVVEMVVQWNSTTRMYVQNHGHA